MSHSELKFLHSQVNLIELKLEYFRHISTEELIESLKLDKEGVLKTEKDGTIMDGHHRIQILIERGIEANKLPHEIWERTE